MIITNEIQNELSNLFKGLIHMAILSNKSKGYYQLLFVGENVTLNLYDKRQNDNTKQIVFTKSFDLSIFADYQSAKKIISPILEKELREFCKS